MMYLSALGVTPDQALAAFRDLICRALADPTLGQTVMGIWSAAGLAIPHVATAQAFCAGTLTPDGAAQPYYDSLVARGFLPALDVAPVGPTWQDVAARAVQLFGAIYGRGPSPGELAWITTNAQTYCP